MVDVRFQPAAQADAWRAVVSGQSVAVLPPSTTAHTAEAVWRRLAGGGIAALIEGLTGAFGTSLSAIPPFAFATVEDDGVRVAVRGPVELIVESAEGTEAVSGAGVATWVERLIPGTFRVTLTLDAAGDGAEALPLLDGVVPVAGLVLITGPTPPAAAAAAVGSGGVDAGAATATPGSESDAVDPGAAAVDTSGTDAAGGDVEDPAGEAPGEAAGDADAAAGAAAGAAAVGVGAGLGAGAAGDGAEASGSSAAAPFVGSRWSADEDDDDADTPEADAAAADASGSGESAEPGAGADIVDEVPGAASDAPIGETAAPDASSAEPGAAPGGDPHTVSEAAAETWLPGATAVPPTDDDIVFGATVARPSTAGAPASTSAPSAAPVPPMPPVPPVPPLPDLGDHDGATIAVSELRKLREAEREQYESTENVPPRQPSRGRIRLSTGRTVELERPVVIGRRPKSTRASGDELPTLVAVDSPNQDISRSHVEIRAEGEHVLVTDLNTTNGTVLLRTGSDPVRLHPGEPTLVVDADVLDLGDGVTLTFEDLP